MYFDDHDPPHFHVEYQGHEALVAIATGEILAGRLPKKVHKIVRGFLTLGAHAWPNGLEFSAASLLRKLAERGQL
jgi:hypothetical protein